VLRSRPLPQALSITMDDSVKVTNWWEILLLLAAYAFPIGFFVYSWVSGEGHWFARSGALMVIIGAVLEYRNFGFQQYLRERRDETWKPDPKWIKALRSRLPFDILILAALVIGTLVWAYGDLLFTIT
jgi:hypothetical protein